MTTTRESSDSNFVLTLEEIGNLAAEEGKPADTLMNVVALIASRFRTDVCSAYLLEPDRSNLVLAATLGLHPRCIGALRMPLHEGLSGLVAEQLLPVAVADARNHPRYKYFKESGEDEYRSFLGVPLIDRGVLQGVLVVQTKEPRVFREHEIRMLAEAASQVAPVVSEARTLDRFIAPAQDVSFDRLGRLVIPPLLRTHAGLNGDIVWVGQTKRFELWSAEQWNKAKPDHVDVFKLAAKYNIV